MTADTPSNSETIVLTSDDGTKPLWKLIFYSVIMLAIGTPLVVVGGWSGSFAFGLGIACLIIGLVKTTTATTFDFTRREVTIGKIGVFQKTIRWTLPFDMVQGVFIPPGTSGATLVLKNGAALRMTDSPEDYTTLDRRLADIRTRLGIATKHPASPIAELSPRSTFTPNGTVTFTLSGQGGPFVGVVLMFIGCAIGCLAIFPVYMLLSMPVVPGDTVFIILAILMLPLMAAFLVAVGVHTFRQIKALALDPETRLAHVISVCPSIQPEEIIPFDDFAAAGVWEDYIIGRDDTHKLVPYVQLTSGRRIQLYGVTDTFRAAEDNARFICQLTGAKFRNMSELEGYAERGRARASGTGAG